MEPIYVRVEPPETVVAGWLLLFCLVLTVACPASIFYGVFVQMVPSLFRKHALKFEILCLLYIILFSIVGILSLIAGWRLWMIKPGAVRSARRFLWIFLLVHFAYFVSAVLLFRPTHLSTLAPEIWAHVAGPIPFFFLWTSYLEHSRRVKRTYVSEFAALSG